MYYKKKFKITLQVRIEIKTDVTTPDIKWKDVDDIMIRQGG